MQLDIENIQFNLPLPYSAGQQITSIEAEELNRVYFDRLCRGLNRLARRGYDREILQRHINTFNFNPPRKAVVEETPRQRIAREILETGL
jgi:hypothetical protein